MFIPGTIQIKGNVFRVNFNVSMVQHGANELELAFIFQVAAAGQAPIAFFNGGGTAAF